MASIYLNNIKLIDLLFPAIAIFCMLLTYYGWIKAVKTGSTFWAIFTALAYFYMVTPIKFILDFGFYLPASPSYFVVGILMGRLCVLD